MLITDSCLPHARLPRRRLPPAAAAAAAFNRSGPNSTYWGGQTHTIQPCRARTVIMAEQLYAADAALLGYSFADAHDACEKYRQSHPPGNAENMTAAELSGLRGRNKQLLLKDSEIAARWQYMPDQG